MRRFLLAVLLAALPAVAQADLLQCVQDCIDGAVPGITPPPSPPVQPPTTPPPMTSAPFPHTITFENSADQANGNAAILFRTIPDGTVRSVSVNGEPATLGRPYKGASVFLLSKPGEQYSRPLKFTITTSDGKTWTATSGAADNTDQPTTGYNKSKKYQYFNHANGRQAWRIPENGPWFGQPVKVVFSSGKEFTVKNTSKNCRDQESDCQRNSKAKMYGFVWKSGIGPNGEGDENTGTSHHGVYIHAPHGDTSTSLIIYYNK